MKISVSSHSLKLRHPFGISRGTSTVCRTVVVEVSDWGQCGWGEAGANSYYQASIESITASVEKARPILGALEPAPAESLWARLHEALRGDTFALCALDCALHDLWGKIQRKPVWQLWGLSLAKVPPSDYTIGLDTIEVMVQKLREMPGWPIYKIKVGVPHDLEIVRRLRAETDAVFRVDANAGWQPEEAARKIEALAELGVELVEQPLPPQDWDSAAWLYTRSALPLIADESCRTEKDLERCLGCFHGVNVKVVKCGGLTPAKHILEKARRLGMRTMVGCMTESTIGISAAAQLLPLVEFADLDGAILLAEDLADGVRFERGLPIFPNTPGCGITPLRSLSRS